MGGGRRAPQDAQVPPDPSLHAPDPSLCPPPRQAQASFLAVASNQLSVPASNLAIGSTSTMSAGSRRRLLQTNSTVGVNVNLTIIVRRPP